MVKEPYFEREVEPGVWQIGGFHGGGFGVNAAILTSGHKGVVVDTLAKPVETRRLLKRVHRLGIDPIALVNTHWHTDHTAGNCLYDCPIWSRRGGTRFLKHYWSKWVGKPGEKRAGGLRVKPPDHQFVRRASLDLDGDELQFIPLPGHTLDSIGVYVPSRRVLIAGDAVMDLPFVWFGDSRKAIRSLREVQGLRPRLILQGHGPPCSYERVASDIRYLERIRKAAAKAKADGVPRRDFVNMPMEGFLTPSRGRELGESWHSIHVGNLWKVWIEAGRARR
jgi:cyclase